MKIFTTKIYILLLLILPSSFATAREEKEFDYTQSVALILKVENGGHIFQRPDYDDPKNAFRMAFGIIQQYLGQIQSEHSGLTLDIDSLAIDYNFVLINHEDTKLFHMGDHWIGDEIAFAVMTHEDYSQLKDIFDSTKRHRNSATSKNSLDYYINDIHQLWQQNTEEYFREYYFPKRANLSQDKSLPDTSRITTEDNRHLNTANRRQSTIEPPSTQTDSVRQQNNQKHTPGINNATQKTTLTQAHELAVTQHTTTNLVSPTQSSAKKANTDYQPLLVLFFSLVLIFIYFGWWKRR